jgi:hypothetical protein
MIQAGNLTFKCATALKRGRYVTVTPGTDTVAYTGAGAAATGVTLWDAKNGVVAVQLLKNVSESYWFEAESAFALGDEIEVGTDGKGTLQVAGSILGYSKQVCAAGNFSTGYNI